MSTSRRNSSCQVIFLQISLFPFWIFHHAQNFRNSRKTFHGGGWRQLLAWPPLFLQLSSCSRWFTSPRNGSFLLLWSSPLVGAPGKVEGALTYCDDFGIIETRDVSMDRDSPKIQDTYAPQKATFTVFLYLDISWNTGAQILNSQINIHFSALCSKVRETEIPRVKVDSKSIPYDGPQLKVRGS